jgi:Leucine-rich repeat (LRR) protein
MEAMKMKMKTGIALLLLICLLLSMVACASSDPEDNEKNVRELTIVVTADNISQLEDYPYLKKVDLTGSTCYKEIASFIATHSDIEVIYTVDMGGTTVGSGETALTLADGAYDYDTLLTNLKYLPKVASLSLPATRLTAEQVEALRQSCPTVEINCTIRLNGTELGVDTTELNLSTMTAEQVNVYAAKLGLLPNLSKVELMGADGTSKLSLQDVKKLQTAAPDVTFNYAFNLFGQTVSLSAERVEFVNVKIGDEGERQIRDALDVLTNCTYFKLDNCGLSNEVLAQLRTDYPDIEIVWNETPDKGPDQSDPGPSDPGSSDPGPTGGPNSTPPRKVTTTVTADTISKLEQYKYLEEADLSGSTCYDAILAYMKAHPTVDVYFNVPLGGTTVKNTTADLSLKQGSYTYDTLLKNLKYVTSLKHLSLPGASLTAQQIKDLRSAYPALDISYTMAVQGVEVNETTTSVDLSAMKPDQVDGAIELLKQYSNVVYVELMNGGKTSLSIADVKKLQDALPNVVFHYSFELFGKTVSTTDQRIEYVKNKNIGDSDEAKIREALDILDGCTYFLLDDCGLSNQVLAKIRSDYPETKVVWRIHQYNKGRSWLTDTKVLRAVYGINDDNSYVLRYLNEVKYMDLGHNTEMVDISFCAYMPDLEIAILSGAPIKDVSPLANCKKLEFLELAWCGQISNISALAGCDGLRHLNLGQTRVKDLSPLKDLKLLMLSHVTSGNMGITAADWQAVQAQHPDCWITSYHKDGYPYSTGWRFKATSGYTEIYRKVRDVFGYDEIDKVIQGQN